MRFFFLICLMWLMPCLAFAQEPSAHELTETEFGPQIEFTQGEYILVDGLTVPKTGWETKPNPHIYRLYPSGWKAGDYHTLMGRFHFDRRAVSSDTLALYTVSTRNSFIIFVNGTEVYRNYARVDEKKNTWYRPYLVPLPDDLLKPGTNEITFQVHSQESVGIGRVIIGAHEGLQPYYDKKFFWQISGPVLANVAMVLLGLFVFLFWLGRRQEIELFWLSAATFLWFFRNHLYFGETIPIHLESYILGTVWVTYFGAVATAAFYLYFIRARHRKKVVTWMFLAGIPLVLLGFFYSKSDLLFYAPTMLVVFTMANFAIVDLFRHRNFERGVLAFGMAVTPVASVYDLAMAMIHQGDGSASYVAIFGGLFYTAAFIISFGKRAMDAFVGLEKSNVILEQRIEEVKADLAASEERRQALVVGQAIADERGRLMQEMHDGIGSNLITALAVARQQKQPKSTQKTLQRALTDLKITVDSLEPVEGDFVALIGNLRHRMAGDLRDAGIDCKWEVEECAPLPWLDATNALHVLRIYNEAIGNILIHSGATEMRIGCQEKDHEGVPGISAYVADNGIGFDTEMETAGKGLANIRARAKSLHGKLSYKSNPQKGTVVTLWLPYVRLNLSGRT